MEEDAGDVKGALGPNHGYSTGLSVTVTAVRKVLSQVFAASRVLFLLLLREPGALSVFGDIAILLICTYTLIFFFQSCDS